MPDHISNIYHMLQGQTLDELTVTNLDTATGRTFINHDNLEFWKGILTLSHITKAYRTYAHGLPLPETAAIEVVTIADGATGTVKPQGDTEIWRVESIDLDNCAVAMFDGATASPIEASRLAAPFLITAKVYLAFSNASGGEQTPSIAYSKVSL